jgi:hypothetical protein
MRKLKRSLKKRKGLEAKIKRQEFLHALKHGKPNLQTNIGSIEAQEILKKIRNRRNLSSPYNAGAGGTMDNAMKKVRKMAGLE